MTMRGKACGMVRGRTKHRAKLRLVDEYNLGGVGYWTINPFFPQNWYCRSMYTVRSCYDFIATQKYRPKIQPGGAFYLPEISVKKY